MQRQILTEHINKWHETADRKPEDDAGEIHPSSLNECLRYAFYKYKGVPRDIEANQFLKRIFFNGYRVEDVMAEALEEAGLLIAKSVAVEAEYDGIPIVGEIDYIIKWEDGWCIADCKSISDAAFKYKNFPYYHHVLQLGAYQWALQEMMIDSERCLAREIANLAPEAEYPPVLFYIGRGHLMDLPPISIGDNAEEQALDTIGELTAYIGQELEPPRPFETPEEHEYLCARRTRTGYMKKDGTYSSGNEPEYQPSCAYFRRCWGCMPESWNFWRIEEQNRRDNGR